MYEDTDLAQLCSSNRLTQNRSQMEIKIHFIPVAQIGKLF